ncbi:PP2C family protein-serine/threonine phosphatase [Actinotalea sp. Marseille-Q4924]|uniref:PP2C family protein-serine/threonine phosphatase n=1 Tax=Actinotalea sp. Marseille-Q4924 TaxID=2866571 RepID=UPI001CE472B6|nr:SpoIIE family protein phosphatase [Actinotalea sp. Marseille-Q4924]
MDDLTAHMSALWRARGVGIVLGHGESLLRCNDEFGVICGRTAAEVTSLTWREITPPDRHDRDLVMFQQFLTVDSASLFSELALPDGGRRPVLVAAALVDQEGPRWIAVVIDLSKDEQLRRMAEADAAILSTLLEDAPFGFALLSNDLRFLRINHELAAMNGHSVAEHEGRFVFDVLPQLRESAEPILRHVLETGEPLREVEIVGETDADPGVEHIWRESFFPVRAPGRPAVGIAALARDETELRRLQQEIEALSDQRRQALEELQRSLLPTRVPRVAGFDVAARYMSASEEVRLGGDWFDVVLMRDGRLALSIGDAVGHGIAAIGLMSRASGAMRAYVSQQLDPDAMLRNLDLLMNESEGEAVASALVGRLSLDGVLEYSTAGHPYALLRCADGGVQRLTEAQGPLLGARRHPRYRSRMTTLDPGGALVLYTDGLIERRDESLAVGMGRLAGAIAGQPPGGSAEDLVAAVLEACLDDRSREDDVCVIAVVRSTGVDDDASGGVAGAR